ncbi:MAG: Na+/H+ antiporter subunit G [Thermoplasmata archaeon]|nr:MAG: Na+/H+ antiporter subunit G [Thermoplasmata archaeon]MCD6147572.1 Na+/H+ antiporter subunit G [Thermoplasmata archaeon]RLF45400.1 MAG: cation:proton antiporter [Thermoplasmata archaeon]HDH81850.1 Na+/H+ antiporter subunit G [Thermoplasmatales archaeon]
MIEELLDYIGMFFVLIGSLFFLFGTIGLVRMPDLYNRMQASTKTTTLGVLSFLVGIGLMELSWLIKLLIIAFFVVLTAPIGASALARASYKHGIKLWKKSVVDKYKEGKND